MERVLISGLNTHKNNTVKLQGWIVRIRQLRHVIFVILRDRTGQIQVVFEPSTLGDLNLSTESVVEVTGLVKEESRSRIGYEVIGHQICVLNKAEELPFPVNTPELTASLETILNHRMLSLRHEFIHPVFKIQAALVHGFQTFLNKKEFIQVFSPKIVGNGTEGGTDVFALKYFEKQAFLAQSPQFYKQMLVGAGYERVYEIGHVYRAEKHATTRHINEYVSLDLEMAFIQDERDLMALENSLLASMLSYVRETCHKELATLGIEVVQVPTIPQVPLQEALSILENKYGKSGLGKDLDPEGERLICQYAEEQWNSEFVFIIHYPQEKRPMYTMPAPNGLTHSFDLLYRGVEITTGGQRIHNHNQLVESMRNKGLNPDNFQSYLEAFQLGMPPHGGLAIGLERLTAGLLRLPNIRQATLFPRDQNRLEP